MQLSRYLVTSDLLTDASNRPERILFSTRTGNLCEIGEAAWQAVARADFESVPSGLIETLFEQKFLVPDDSDELNEIVSENLDAIAKNEVLYEVIQPSAWCQLGCSYCGQVHDKRKLSVDDQLLLIQRIEAKLKVGNYTKLHVGWFGGEPLAALSVIRSLSPDLLEIAERYDCEFSAKIVTNGLNLTPDVASELVQLHHIAAAEVTIDGVGELHDASRPTKRGGGTFHRIFENVRSVVELDAGLEITVRCNVSRANAESVPALIDLIAEAGLAGRIEFYTSPVYSWGNDAHLTSLSKDDYAEAEMEWLAQQIRLGFRPAILPGRREIVCLSVQPDAEVTDATGNRYNCTEVPYVPAYVDKDLYSYGASGRPDKPEAAKLRTFNEDLLAGEYQTCQACPMLPVCGGQCPKSWIEGVPACPSPKHNIRQRLNILYAITRGENERQTS